MKLRFILILFAVTFFTCGGALAEDVSVDELKVQIERMERMLKAQQRQINELKHTLEEKVVRSQGSGARSQEPPPPSPPIRKRGT